jgi:hypothetical protein
MKKSKVLKEDKGTIITNDPRDAEDLEIGRAHV